MTKKSLEYPIDNTSWTPSGICSKLEHGEHNGRE